MRTRAAVVIVGLTACRSDSKPEEPPPKPSEVAKAPDGAKEAAHEIAKEPRTAMAGKTGFLEFTIDVPPSASMPIKGDTVTSWTFKSSKLDLAVREQGGLPSQSNPKRAPTAIDQATTTRDVTEEPGAYVAVDRKNDASGFRIEYCRDLDPSEPPSGICCSVALNSDTPIIDIDKLIAFGNQVCRSIKVKNRKVQ